MMALARRRIQVSGWHNVTLIESAAHATDVPEFDAVLFHYTHDVLQSSAALARLFARAKPGARVAVAGAKFTSWWLAPLNLWVMIRAKPYLSTYAGLRQPWRNLQTYVPDLTISSFLLDTGYIAHGKIIMKAISAGPNMNVTRSNSPSIITVVPEAQSPAGVAGHSCRG